ncbi:MAG: DNA-3-methyladenine glycosylase [Pseudomonas sp.]
MSATYPSNRAISPLTQGFFDRDSRQLAPLLLGKIIRHYHRGLWLSARIIETEAYQRAEKGSHASLGLTQSRRALFMPAGTLYMYYARGGDSLNISSAGEGDGVLIKSGYPVVDDISGPDSLALMRQLNPAASGEPRDTPRLCNGQTLLCRSLQLKVPEWNAQQLDPQRLIIDDDGYRPEQIIQTTRLGIPLGRDEHLPYRFVDSAYAPFCTRNPLGRTRQEGRDYRLLNAVSDEWIIY